MLQVIIKKHTDAEYREEFTIKSNALTFLINELVKRDIYVSKCSTAWLADDIMVIENEIYRIYVIS